MVSEISNQHFIFWARNWRRGLPPKLDFVKCVLSQEQLTIETTPAMRVPLNAIVECETFWGGPAASMLHFIRVVLRSSADPLVLLLVNPLEPASNKNRAEVDAFLKVIQAFKNHEQVDLHTNPYARQMVYDGHPHDIYDLPFEATISPQVYYHRFHSGPSLVKTLFRILAITALLMTALMIVGWMIGVIRIGP